METSSDRFLVTHEHTGRSLLAGTLSSRYGFPACVTAATQEAIYSSWRSPPLCSAPEKEKFEARCDELGLLVSFLYENGWVEEALEKKLAIAALWAPCLEKGEVESLFSVEPLREIRDALWDAITIWDGARIVDASKKLPFPKGEVFFEAEEWSLIPLEAIPGTK